MGSQVLPLKLASLVRLELTTHCLEGRRISLPFRRFDLPLEPEADASLGSSPLFFTPRI